MLIGYNIFAAIIFKILQHLKSCKIRDIKSVKNNNIHTKFIYSAPSQQHFILIPIVNNI
jgi:hypothetical protein